ncbi:type II secretion system F family protein [candidate division WWE3 bacterium]|uniref:Type II secretion system F family protein n=1 Tax=candidate division WWE3 bacterium TaxID=2053526 RepID=A0A955LJY7_UNCKA|nr:type II secretion system F family protein [candidate division WWE3 bacterium]
MKVFEYTAVDADGIPQSGELHSLSRQQAVSTLKAKNFIVTKLEEKKNNNISDIVAKFKGVGAREIIMFTRQLGTMIGAGLPINQALRILGNQTENAYFSEVISDVIQQIDGGASFHDSLAAHDKVFGNLYLSLVKAGESSGNLEEVLLRISATMESEENFKGKVKGAMIYPLVIAVVMIGVLAIMFLFVIPQIANLYDDLGADLPFITQIMIDFSRFMTKFWWVMILMIVGIVVGMKRLMQKPDFARKYNSGLLHMPVFGALSTEVQLTSFTRTLSMLVKSGIPLLEALDIAKETLTNLIFKDAAAEAALLVEKGKPLADAFRRYKEFPPIMAEMLNVGEQTGKVDDVLAKVAEYFGSQAERKTENLASAIEPIVIVMLGVMVGFLVISLILPIYSLTSQF